MITVQNWSIINKDARGMLCIGEFGFRVFANVNFKKKITICKNLEERGITLYPHTLDFVFAVGRATVGLHMFAQALIDADLRTVRLIAYGMKMPYAECEYLDCLEGPSQGRRFDVGQNILAPFLTLLMAIMVPYFPCLATWVPGMVLL